MKPKLEQILRLDKCLNLISDRAMRTDFLFASAPKPIIRLPEPASIIFLEADERAAADEEDAARVDADVFLLRMLAAALGRDVADGAFEDFQQRLLHAFAGNVARDGNVLGLAGDLVDLVDVNDAASGRASRRNPHFAGGAE